MRKQKWTNMNIPWSTLRVAMIVILTTCQFTMLLGNKQFERAETKKVLSKNPGLIKAVQADESIDYIKSYLIHGRRNTEKLLGKTKRFFPLFEDHIQRYKLPDALKYLPMIESRLEPYAKSTAGAAGLWQLMPSTARALGLVIESKVDERKDPIKSTRVALGYLKKQYKRFGTWELALAAYNCGSGNVQKAINKGGSKDFWKIKQYLPKETQRYISKFIAVDFVVNHYKDYNIKPRLPKAQLIYTRTKKIKEGFTFKEIAKMTGISKSIIKKLNPSYRQNLVPASKNGNYLILPRKGMIAFQEFHKSERQRQIEAINNGPSKEIIKSELAIGIIADELYKNCMVYQKNVKREARKKLLNHYVKTAHYAGLAPNRKGTGNNSHMELSDFLITTRRRRAARTIA